MRIFDIRSQVLGYSVMLLLSMSTMAWAEEPPLPLSGEGQARGVVLGIVGMPVRIVAPAATPGGTLNVGDVISAGMSCGWNGRASGPVVGSSCSADVA